MYDLHVALSTGSYVSAAKLGDVGADDPTRSLGAGGRAPPHRADPGRRVARRAGRSSSPGRLVGVDVADGGPQSNRGLSHGRANALATRDARRPRGARRTTSRSSTTSRAEGWSGERRHARCTTSGWGSRRSTSWSSASAGPCSPTRSFAVDVRAAGSTAQRRSPAARRGERPRAAPDAAVRMRRSSGTSSPGRSRDGFRRLAPRSTGPAATPRTGCSTTTSVATSGCTTSSPS